MANETTVAAPVKISGSKAIQRVLKEKGLDTPAKDVAVILKEEGIEVSVGLINNIKTRIRQVKEEKRAARKKGNGVPASVVSPVQGEFDTLLEVKAFAAKVGGAGKLREMLEKLEKLAS